MTQQSLAPSPMSDQDREAYIRICGEKMVSLMCEWGITGCFDARGEAELWNRRMAEAIKQRSPEQVARMEAERGLV